MSASAERIPPPRILETAEVLRMECQPVLADIPRLLEWIRWQTQLTRDLISSGDDQMAERYQLNATVVKYRQQLDAFHAAVEDLSEPRVTDRDGRWICFYCQSSTPTHMTTCVYRQLRALVR